MIPVGRGTTGPPSRASALPGGVSLQLKSNPLGGNVDSQVVELLGRNRLIDELLRAGLEVAVPERDRGIDLIAYLDLDPGVNFGWESSGGPSLVGRSAADPLAFHR